MRYFVLVLLCIAFSKVAVADIWNLPQELSTANTEVTFEVDSTWHLVKGRVNEIHGKLWVEDPRDFQSLRGEVRLPIHSFDTDNGRRDEKMRGVMHQGQSPDVEFSLLHFDGPLCNPATLTDGIPCNGVITGELTINRTRKSVQVKTSVKKMSNEFRVTGATTLKWSDYNVEDPSILIAKLDEEVTIKIDVVLGLK